MTGNCLVIVSPTPRAETSLSRYAMFAFAVGAASATTDDGAGTIWAVDSGGILILPADRQRLELNRLSALHDEPNG